MSDKKISALPSASSFLDGDFLVGNQAGVTSKFPFNAIKSSSPYTINNVNGGYTLVLSDAEKLLVAVSGTIITIPLNADVAFPIGSWIDILMDSSVTDSISVVAAIGVTFTWAFSGGPSAAYIYGSQTRRLIKNATNEWYIDTAIIVGVNGIVKYDGTGQASPAVAGTDYVAPGGVGTIPVSTGWAVPASDGNKATVLTNYNTAGLATAAGVVGLGDTNTQVGELTDVLQALITKLRADGVLTS